MCNGRKRKNRWLLFQKHEKYLKALIEKHFFLTSKNTDGGDPAQILMDYIRMLTHIDILVYNGL